MPSSPELASLALYEQNVLSVTRQVHYSTKDAALSLDMVLSLNGLPVATVELKSPFTDQTVEHAKKQYKFDRDPRELLLRFKTRALVHFAVDPDLVFMTTKLAGKDTIFLPFNKGRGTGAGNPDNANGYKTAYLWEEVWSKDRWLDIIARFVHLRRAPDRARRLGAHPRSLVKSVMLLCRRAAST
jgi:type I restriction enzyme R subunit